jgi:hypothetical protein
MIGRRARLLLIAVAVLHLTRVLSFLSVPDLRFVCFLSPSATPFAVPKRARKEQKPMPFGNRILPSARGVGQRQKCARMTPANAKACPAKRRHRLTWEGGGGCKATARCDEGRGGARAAGSVSSNLPPRSLSLTTLTNWSSTTTTLTTSLPKGRKEPSINDFAASDRRCYPARISIAARGFSRAFFVPVPFSGKSDGI